VQIATSIDKNSEISHSNPLRPAYAATACHQFYTISIGFQYVRSLWSFGTVSMVLLLHICRNFVSRSKTSEGDHSYGLHLLDVFS